jgi:hypothetical protein
MATSGVTTFNPVRDQIVNGALRLVGAYASTDSPRPEQSRDALEALNMMLKSWQIDGLLWLKETGVLFLSANQYQYDLGATGDHCVSDYVQTTLAANALAGAGSVTLTSATGVTDGDFIGISNNNGVIEWFYVNMTGAVAALFSDVTLLVPATLGVAAASGNNAFSHTVAAQMGRPTRIFTATRKSVQSGYEIPMIQIAREDYLRLPNKATASTPVQFYYDPQLVLGKVNIWPAPSSTSDVLVLNMDRTIQDMVSDLNTFDLPQEWAEAIKYNLAAKIAAEYGLPMNERQMLQQEAMALKENIKSYSIENASTFFGVQSYGSQS